MRPDSAWMGASVPTSCTAEGLIPAPSAPPDTAAVLPRGTGSRRTVCEGDGRVDGGSLPSRPKAGRHDPVRRGRRYKRAGRCHAGPFQETRPPRMRRPQKPGSAGPQVRPLQRTARFSRCGTGCARAGLPYAQNPGRPARRLPRFICGLPAWGQRLAGPRPFVQNPEAKRRRAPPHARSNPCRRSVSPDDSPSTPR